MKKLLAFAGAIIILGAGCSSSEPKTQNQTTSGDGVTAGLTSYTTAEVASANSESKCWTTINGKVYDLTSYLLKHPGGKRDIMKICGIDGTIEFNKMHGGGDKAIQMLKTLEIGLLK